MNYEGPYSYKEGGVNKMAANSGWMWMVRNGGGEVPKMKCRYSQFFTCHLQKRLVHTVVTPFLHSDKDLLLAE